MQNKITQLCKNKFTTYSTGFVLVEREAIDIVAKYSIANVNYYSVRLIILIIFVIVKNAERKYLSLKKYYYYF